MIYLASPYSHPDELVREARFKAVCVAAADMMRGGLMVLSPIAHTHPIAVIGELGLEWEYWAAYDAELIARCDEVHVLMLEGWKESIGVTAEIALAESLGKPIQYRAEQSTSL